MPKPELGRVSVGDTLFVIHPGHRYRSTLTARVVVTKVARVWITVEEINEVSSFRETWRLRLDTQGGGTYNSLTRFVTEAQLLWEQRVSAAEKVLREAKVAPNFDSPWNRDEDRLIALADFIGSYGTEEA